MPNTKQYDLEERTLKFARNIRVFVKLLPKNTANFEDGKQLIRSSGSVGANYIEANESLSKKDFVMRIMICRKEAKESEYWLNLIETDSIVLSKNKAEFIDEATQLRKIFGSILEKSK
ncbi:MAG: four helix bundle protein [bacterium]|nr:four helix bundle protein [bacterium]